MAKDNSHTIYILTQASNIIASRVNLSELSENNPKLYSQYAEILTAFRKIGFVVEYSEKYQLDSLQATIDGFDLSVIQKGISDLSASQEKEGSRSPEVKQEDNTVPAELESMVAEYEKFKAEQKDNDGSSSSVAEAVKRAREAMIIRERLKSIRENRASLAEDGQKFNETEDKRYEDLLTKIVNPKAKDSSTLLEPVETTLVEAVHSYIDQRTDISNTDREKLSLLTPEIVKNAQYLYLTGALNISNRNDLIVGVEVALHLTSPQTNTPITLIYDDLVKQENEINSIRQSISIQELKISSLQNKLEKASTKEELTKILGEIATVQTGINNLSSNINSIPTKLDSSIADRAKQIENHLESQADGTINNNNVIKYEKNEQGNYVPVKNEDGSLVINRDFSDNLSEKAGKTISIIHEKLIDGGIKGSTPPAPNLLAGAVEVENAIRKDIPGVGISLNATYEASQVAVLLRDPKSQNPDLSAEAVLLFGKGVTVKKLDEIIDHAEKNPTSDIGRLLKANPYLFGDIRHQLSNIEATSSESSIYEKTSQYAKDNPNSTLGQLYSQNKAAYDAYLKLSEKLNPNQIISFAKNNPDSTIGKLFQSNSKIFGKAKNELDKIKNSTLAKEIGKPIGRVSKFITTTQNKITSVFGKVTPFARYVMDPVGSLRSYLGRRAGEYLLKKVASVLSQKTGELLLKHGLRGAAKELAKQAAKRVAVEAAKLTAKVGIKVSLQAVAQTLNAIPGLGLVAAVVIEVLWAVGELTIGLAKKGLDEVWMALYGQKFSLKTAARDTATAVGGLAITGTTAIVGFTTAVIAAAAVAATSALGIIVLSVFVGFFVYISTFVVAPLISTLAQLESQPSLRVSGECTWPIHGGKTVCQGPLGIQTHSRGVQGIDICGTNADEIHAVADGEVTFAGTRPDIYGNTVIIATQTSAGNFDVWYNHMSSIGVSQGDLIKQNQVIGTTGNTGSTSQYTMSDHLHMEYRNGAAYNDCPAGGIPVPERCVNDYAGAERCQFNGADIITD